jgi:hypothetical protein
VTLETCEDINGNIPSIIRFGNLMSRTDSEIEQIKSRHNTEEFVYLGNGWLRMPFNEAISYLKYQKL